MLKNFKPRLYQEIILDSCLKNNVLVVLPTGMGKTAIAMLLAVHRLKNYVKSKILLLAPTRPLALQHLETFKKFIDLPETEFALFTGNVSPKKRAEMWDKSTFFFSTPQGVENDIINNKVPLKDISLLVFDEAHRAVGDYAYVFIAKQYHKKASHEKSLSLTASPGADFTKIKEVCKNLYVDAVEVRTETDPDVKEYVQDIDITWIQVEFPKEFQKIQKYLQDSLTSKMNSLKEKGFLPGSITNYTKKALLMLQRDFHSRLATGERDYNLMKSISLLAEVMKIQHALELLETQGISILYTYFLKIEEQSKTTKVKAVQNLLKDINFKSAIIKTRHLVEEEIDHPKLNRLKEIVAAESAKNSSSKMILFTQFRNGALKMKEVLDEINVSNKIFVGQMKRGDTGMSQKEQKQIIEEFRENKFTCLISTSVGEEGLDIPEVDVVLFYEPIPSAIRHIQRRGRTGRQADGKVYIFVTGKTRDEAYRWSSHYKEKKMYKNLERLKKEFNLKSAKKEYALDKFVSSEQTNIKIVVDYREKSSGVIKELIDLGVEIDMQKLDVGDYLLSENLVVEYKTQSDFVESIIDGRLLPQVKDLNSYEKSLVVIEGEENLYSQRNIHPNAVRGMIAAISVGFGIPLLSTKHPKDTAALFYVIAKRLQDPEKKDFSMHTSKPRTLKEQQEYVVGSFPGIGPTLSKPLLKKFKSIKKLVNASEDALKKVDLIGELKAKKIRDLIDSEYQESS